MLVHIFHSESRKRRHSAGLLPWTWGRLPIRRLAHGRVQSGAAHVVIALKRVVLVLDLRGYRECRAGASAHVVLALKRVREMCIYT